MKKYIIVNDSDEYVFNSKKEAEDKIEELIKNNEVSNLDKMLYQPYVMNVNDYLLLEKSQEINIILD